MTEIEDDLLAAKLNLETAKIHWAELQRFFAQGKVFVVNENKDLVSIAQAIATDQSDQIEVLIQNKSIEFARDEQAKKWISDNVQVWAVVVAPWILVQESD